MTYIICDLEATCCDDGTIPRDEMEIIEIGAVAVAADSLSVLDEFCCLVRPVRHPRLTEFCTTLTSIDQALLDAEGIPFPDALGRFVTWFAAHVEPVFCSWGNYDRNQFRRDCAFHGVDYPFGNTHINIKKCFAANHGRKPCGLGQALRLAGLDFDGRPHRGIDDARNMARLAGYIFGRQRVTD